MPRTALPFRRRTLTRDFIFEDRALIVSVGFDPEGQPREVFATSPDVKEGSGLQAVLSDACILISIALQWGVPPAELAATLGRRPRWTDGVEAEGPASPLGLILDAIMAPAEA